MRPAARNAVAAVERCTDYGKRDDSKSLADFIDDQFRKLAADGTMAKLQEKWFGFTMELPTDALPEPKS